MQEIEDNNIYVALTPISIPAFKNDLNLIRTKELHRLIENDNVVKRLQTNINGSIVLLNEDNSKIIEEKIKDDEGYTDYGRITYNYYFKATCSLKENKDEEELKRKYMDILRAIDIVNSTNVWRYDKKSDHQKMKNIRDYICGNLDGFKNCLAAGDLALVENIRAISMARNQDVYDENQREAEENNPDDEKQGERSFSSKVCKYFDEYMNANDCSYDNNYYIDDFYVRAMLPYYLHYYCCLTDDTMVPKDERVSIDKNIITFNNGNKAIVSLKINNGKTLLLGNKKNDKDEWSYRPLSRFSTDIRKTLSYEELFGLLEILRVISGCGLTRSQLDHIIWYCYKSYAK